MLQSLISFATTAATIYSLPSHSHCVTSSRLSVISSHTPPGVLVFSFQSYKYGLHSSKRSLIRARPEDGAAEKAILFKEKGAGLQRSEYC